ncbi:Myc proto-oncogene protein [Nibea albiflora]|uniref:Myc proto-oncogene protein n=1 Tax=Nibea albiflora TaxID=240163 RepID=A0ACB7FKS4_NIBAL|nr:Myc proto-oncogene protein [Nibea albiflora]
MERQRQELADDKMSILALRDQIPAVANNDKAAKVVILKKATAFIAEIRKDERRLLTTKDELRKRSRELKTQAGAAEDLYINLCCIYLNLKCI